MMEPDLTSHTEMSMIIKTLCSLPKRCAASQVKFENLLPDQFFPFSMILLQVFCGKRQSFMFDIYEWKEPVSMLEPLYNTIKSY